MRQLGLAWRLARRELRGGVRGFAVFLACLTLGVGAIAAVGVLNAGLIDGLERDASALLGGDIEIEVSNLPLAPDELARLTPPDAVRSDSVRTNAMAQGPAGGAWWWRSRRSTRPIRSMARSPSSRRR